MKVRFTRPAQADLWRIQDFISKDNPVAASRVVTRLIERARALAETPFEGRATDKPNLRMIVVPELRYLIFYTVSGDQLQIVHFRHTSRRRRTPTFP